MIIPATNQNLLPAYRSRQRKPLRIMETDRGESRTSFLSHRECMEEEHEYANNFRKQGGKNPRNIPKLTINHEDFRCAIEKKIIRPRIILRNLNILKSYQLQIDPFKERHFLQHHP